MVHDFVKFQYWHHTGVRISKDCCPLISRPSSKGLRKLFFDARPESLIELLTYIWVVLKAKTLVG